VVCFTVLYIENLAGISTMNGICQNQIQSQNADKRTQSEQVLSVWFLMVTKNNNLTKCLGLHVFELIERTDVKKSLRKV